jgi:type VI protein secretion system component Hcp
MAADVFLCLYNNNTLITGSSTDWLFPGAIELQEFSMDAEATILADQDDEKAMQNRSDMMEMPFGGDIKEPEKPLDSFSISFSKAFDISSNLLFQNYALASTQTKSFFSKGLVYCRIVGPTRQTGATPEQLCFLVYEFANLYVYDYELDVSGETSLPTEKCKMYFDKYRITYRQQQTTGQLTSSPLSLGWDFEKSEAY